MNRFSLFPVVILAAGLIAGGCVPGPSLHETRQGTARVSPDTSLRAGEIRAEILKISPANNELHVRSEDGRTRVLNYDLNRTIVTYQGRNYNVENLQAGDIIAFQTQPRDDTVDTIRVQEPVQIRAVSRAGSAPPALRREVVEGTVQRIDHERGYLEVRTPERRSVTVALPYNARKSEVDDFRRLRPGDNVRIEGEFVGRDTFQISAFSR